MKYERKWYQRVGSNKKQHNRCENVRVGFDFPAHPTHSKDNNLCKTDRNQRWNEKSLNILFFSSPLHPLSSTRFYGYLLCWVVGITELLLAWVIPSLYYTVRKKYCCWSRKHGCKLTIRARTLNSQQSIPYWKLETCWMIVKQPTNLSKTDGSDLSQNN